MKMRFHTSSAPADRPNRPSERRRRGLGLLLALVTTGSLGAGVLLGPRAARARPFSHRNAYDVPFTARGNIQYIDAITPHHEHALEMAQMELDKGTRPEVRALAQRIQEQQTAEIALLQAVRAELAGHAQVPRPPRDPHSEADMQRLEAATGAVVDEQFLQHMIPHHAEGISIAHRALPNLRREELIQNAQDVVRNQAREIGEMEALRTGAAF